MSFSHLGELGWRYRSTLIGHHVSGTGNCEWRRGLNWRVAVIDSDDAFRALEAPWNALAARTPGVAFMQTFSWCNLTWLHFPAKNLVRLKCVTAWDDELLVAVWPCIEKRVMGGRHLTQMGFGIGDYARPLIEPVADTAETCEALLRALAHNVDAFDIVCLDFSPAMQSCVSSMRAAHRTVTFDDYSIDPHRCGSWNAFMASLSKNMRNHLQSSRKKLGELGSVTFSISRTPETQARIIDWTLSQKQAWLKRRDLQNDWYALAETRTFLLEAAAATSVGGYMAIFSLQVDDVPLASWFGAINHDRIGALMITFDAEYQKYSPGMLLIQDVVHWGYSCNRVADLGGDEAEFKARWATDRMTRVAYCYAFTARGAVYQLWRWLREQAGPRLKALLPHSVVSRVRHALKRGREEMALSQSIPEAGNG